MPYSLKLLQELITLAQGDRSQNTYAFHCGISSAAITRILSGERKPQPPTLKKLALKAANGVTYEMLLSAAGITEENSQVAEKPKGIRIPVLGSAPAGIPFEAIEDIIDWEEIDENLASSGEYFGLVVKGDSMSPRICDGDIVIVRSQTDINTGETAVIYINGYEATIKKVKRDSHGISLIPLNPSYEVKYYTNEEISTLPISICGKVVELRGKM